jgi:hypothetical protein
VSHHPTAIDKHANLTTDLSRELRELTGEIVVQEDVGVEAASKETFEL